MPTASGGKCSACFESRLQHLVDDDATTPMTAPLPIRPQSRLPPSTPCAIAEMIAACGAAQRVRLGARRALEGEGGVQQVEDRRDDQRAEDHAEHQRDLLPPRRRIDQLAGLQVLEVVVGDGGDAEDDRRHEQGEGDQRLGLVAGRTPRNSAARISEMPRTERMPTPEIGLFDAPIRPAM